ncbi:MAG: rhodanese-like domain-containing protein [Bacteroidia bacterium]
MKTILTTLIAVFAFALQAQNKTQIENVNAAAFKKYIAEKKGLLIDLRTSDEIKNKGMIKGATQIDFLAKNAEEVITNLDHNKTYLVYCAGGGRSSDCADFMKKQGFLHVINLEKGFDDWKKQGFETVAPASK